MSSVNHKANVFMPGSERFFFPPVHCWPSNGLEKVRALTTKFQHQNVIRPVHQMKGWLVCDHKKTRNGSGMERCLYFSTWNWMVGDSDMGRWKPFNPLLRCTHALNINPNLGPRRTKISVSQPHEQNASRRLKCVSRWWEKTRHKGTKCVVLGGFGQVFGWQKADFDTPRV